MLNEVFAWWLRQMIGLVPARFRRAPMEPDALIVAMDQLEAYGVVGGPPSGTIFIRRAGIETFSASLFQRSASDGILRSGGQARAAGRLQTMLRLPVGAILTREVLLPLAAERDLYNVLEFEMDRLTPFHPDEIFWGVTDVRRDSRRRLRMTLLITLRSPVENLLTALARLNLKPAFLETKGGRISLGGTGPIAGRWLLNVLLGLCGTLMIACVLIPLARQQMAIRDAQARIAQLRPAA